MTPQRAKKLLPIITAYAEGKTIQYAVKSSDFKEWKDDLNFNPEYGEDGSIEYRIKPPEPTLRPWKPEEVPVGAIYKSILGTIYYPLSQGDRGVEVSSPPSKGECTVTFIFATTLFDNNWKHSLDGGKTWLPCGVLE